ncbi:MAG: helix-turn-helix domain-containing protein [Deferrisomatales bacterium]
MAHFRDISDPYEKSDKELLRELGARVQAWRLNRNLSQDQVAETAGVGRATVVRLEGGQSVTLLSFVQVLRALGALEELAGFLPEPGVSPLELLERKGRRRRRASPGQSGPEPASGGDEPAW